MPTPKAVLILSGKGGVGKTLIAVNIALHLQDKNVNVGLLDADFSASNTSYFLDLKEQMVTLSQEKFHPVLLDGLEVFSIPLVLGEKSVCMSGDQYTQFLRDAINEGVWRAEYIIVDCPAGYGDELKTAAKVFSDSLLGSIIVIQPAHELDARRAIKLHKDLELSILGLVENMSYFKAGAIKYKIFGESIVEKLGEEFEVPVFGQIPLSMDIRKQIKSKDPKLQKPYKQTIINAREAILDAKPQKPGFLVKLKNWLTVQFGKIMFEIMCAANSEINIPQFQERFGYPGGAIIQLNIMNENMDQLIHKSDWIIQSGKLMVAEGDYIVDAQINITPKAMKWALLGNRVLANGYTYDFSDALRLGHMKIYGDRTMARGAFFMQQVFQHIKDNSNAMNKITPLLELI